MTNHSDLPNKDLPLLGVNLTDVPEFFDRLRFKELLDEIVVGIVWGVPPKYLEKTKPVSHFKK